jgi:ribosome biogenesis GTPase / thiamine phosphate phosphatase
MKATVLAHDGLERIRCRPPRDRTTPAVGDRVQFSVIRGERRIESITERQRCLWRPKEHGRLLMAANVDRVVLVVAPEPRLKLVMVDRVLVAADTHDIDVSIVMNKCDLASVAGVEEALKPYQDLGYRVYGLSALTGVGVDALHDELSRGLNVVIGQSGVGKSTLLNALVPGANLKSGELSRATGKGCHVTTVSTCHVMGEDWPHGGMVVDTPGVRTFGLYRMNLVDLSMGFREMLDLRLGCKFRDCLHESEPDCEVRRALEDGRVSPGRYQRYLNIVESVRSDEG